MPDWSSGICRTRAARSVLWPIACFDGSPVRAVSYLALGGPIPDLHLPLAFELEKKAVELETRSKRTTPIAKRQFVFMLEAIVVHDVFGSYEYRR